MQNRLFLPLSTVVLLFGAAACSNGGGDAGTGDVTIRCGGGQSFCLISCDLGCSQTTCSVTEIAENQRLRWVFSNALAPSSVNRTSVSIRTASGVSPDGELVVSGRELTFVPSVSTSGGTSSFGFQRNEAYVITLASGANGQGVKSVSGDSLGQEFSCTVIASRGILDADALPPTVTLVAPTSTTNVSNTPTIVLRFSELIDTSALQANLTASSPVNIIRRTTVDDGTGLRVCNTDVAGTAIEATPTLTTERVGNNDVTVLTFTPPFSVPGQSCIRVNITGDLRDLSGRAATPVTFELFTAPSTSVPITVAESFANSSQQDLDQSSGEWANGARAGLVGDDGRHGSFSLSLATLIQNTTIYELDTAGTQIPAANTLSGVATTVTDGKYYFSDFVLPANTTLRFNATAGRPVPQIFVRGKVEILGNIDISGADLSFWVPNFGLSNGLMVSDFNGRGTNLLIGTIVQGQPGTAGGIGGGRGGNGGRECNGAGDIQDPPGSGIFIHRGQPGQNVGIPGTHAFSVQAANTGGRGGPLMPAAGTTTVVPVLNQSAVGSPINNVRCQFSRGGTGGAFMLPGGLPIYTSGPVNPAPPAPQPVQLSPAPVAGPAFDLTQPVPVGVASLDHFVVGGSGGGGGGSHAYGTVTLPGGQDFYVAGAAGTGGGGTMAIRAGGNVTISGTLRSRGGGPRQTVASGPVTIGSGLLINGDRQEAPPTAQTSDGLAGVTSPGGGGSGGSFLLQAGGDLTCSGTINTEGGPGSQTGNIVAVGTALANFNVIAKGGAGSPGFYRLEAGGAVTFTGAGSIPAFDAGVNAAALTDRDNITASMSKWRGTGQFFPPTWLRYELDVDIDGDNVVDITYTDSGAPGTQRANQDSDPVRIRFQGGLLNTAGTALRDGAVPGPWRDGVGSGAGPGIGLDSPTGFRFLLRFNRSVAPNCVVRALRVIAQT